MRIVFVCIFGLFVSGAFAISQKDWGEEIRLIEKIDVSDEVQMNTRRGDFRFVSVQGYSEVVPGVNEYQVKYSQYGTRKILGTSDSALGAEHKRFNAAAKKYAREYNLALLKIIKN